MGCSGVSTGSLRCAAARVEDDCHLPHSSVMVARSLGRQLHSFSSMGSGLAGRQPVSSLSCPQYSCPRQGEGGGGGWEGLAGWRGRFGTERMRERECEHFPPGGSLLEFQPALWALQRNLSFQGFVPGWLGPESRQCKAFGDRPCWQQTECCFSGPRCTASPTGRRRH